MVLHHQGKFSASRKMYNKAIKADPKFAEAYNNLGNVLMDQQLFEMAEKSYKEASKFLKDHPMILSNIGFSIQKQGKNEQSIKWFQKAIYIDPFYSDAHCNLGNALSGLKKYDEAIKHYEIAIKSNQGSAESYNGLGVALKNIGKVKKAIRVFSKAIKLYPSFVSAINNRGNAYRDLLYLEKSIEDYKNAIKINQYEAESHFNLSLTLLLSGNFTDGWKEYEWRWKLKGFRSHRPPKKAKQWYGAPLNGQTLLIHAEQGNGDTIQFIRYVDKINKENGKIIVQCQESLTTLLRNIENIDHVVSWNEKLPYFDFYTNLLSLPYILKTSISSIPSKTPYIPSPLFSAIDAIVKSNKMNIGIVWTGSLYHSNDKNRSTSLRYFLDLYSVPNIQLFSLQVGNHSKEFPDGSRSIIDLSNNIYDYSDTATIIKQLDLIISVDTSVAHLAGALAKPVWVLLPFSPDFRWMLNRNDSPWYPTMRLFRQPSPKDWESVFDDVRDALCNI